MLFDISYILLTKIQFSRRRKQKLKYQNTQRAFSKGLKGKKMPGGSGLATPGLDVQLLMSKRERKVLLFELIHSESDN